MIKKTFTIFVLIMFIAFGNIIAQTTVNADIAIPTAKNSKIMIGGSATYIYPIDDAIGIGANAGLRMSLTSDYTYFQIPIMAVGRYYINGDGNGFYPEAQLGFVNSRVKFESSFGSGSTTSSSTNFGFSIGAGYKIEDLVEISARYENIMHKNAHTNIIAFRVGYSF